MICAAIMVMRFSMVDADMFSVVACSVEIVFSGRTS